MKYAQLVIIGGNSKDNKFQRLAKIFLFSTMTTWLDPNFAHRWSFDGRSLTRSSLSYSPVAAKFRSNQVAIVLYRKYFASLWNLVSLDNYMILNIEGHSKNIYIL